MVYYRTNSSKLVWFGIIWLVFAKYHLWGIFPTQFLSKNTNFMSELKNIGKYEVLKFTIPSYILISKVIFNIHSFWYFLILTENWFFWTKTEWEKYPIRAILDKLTKLFQIRQVWTSLCDNKPYPNFASKVVFYDAYHQYKLCF